MNRIGMITTIITTTITTGNGAGFFLCFLYASARTVTCGNGDGCGNSDADAFHDVVCSVIIICLSCILLGLKYLLT